MKAKWTQGPYSFSVSSIPKGRDQVARLTLRAQPHELKSAWTMGYIHAPHSPLSREEEEATGCLFAAAWDMANFINRVAYEPIGPSDASDREILETLTAEARALLAHIEKETT